MSELTLKIIPTHSRFYNKNNGWGVFDFQTDYKKEYEDIKALNCCPFDNQSNGTLVGNMPQLNITQEYTMRVKEVYNKKFECWQFEPITINQEIGRAHV